jgi:Ca2+-binding EF-hand superfamily protein
MKAIKEGRRAPQAMPSLTANHNVFHSMTLNQLLQVMREKSASISKRDVDVLSNLNFLLRRFDLNGNGLIDVEEFRAILKRSFGMQLPR